MESIKQYIQSIGFAFLIKIFSFFKVSFIVGSQMAWFSAISMIAPLSGAFLGIFGSSLVLLIRFVIHYIAFKTISLSFLAFCIPGYFAALYWATQSSCIRVFIPFLCILLFILHPIGSQAFVYSFYWLIPIGLFCIARKSLFLESLGSTFIAHAVGSVIWLYAVPSTVNMWLGLIPIVAIERLLFAIGMVIFYQIAIGIRSLYSYFLPYWGQVVGIPKKALTNNI